MRSILPLMTLIDAYGAATGLPDKTVSFRAFKDSKKISALREGSDITTSRMDEAIVWFSDHWPDGADWPEWIARPPQSAAAQSTEDDAAQSRDDEAAA